MSTCRSLPETWNGKSADALLGPFAQSYSDRLVGKVRGPCPSSLWNAAMLMQILNKADRKGGAVPSVTLSTYLRCCPVLLVVALRFLLCVFQRQNTTFKVAPCGFQTTSVKLQKKDSLVSRYKFQNTSVKLESTAV